MTRFVDRNCYIDVVSLYIRTFVYSYIHIEMKRAKQR